MSKNTNSSVLVINGPNLDMLGVRDTSVYGSNTLASLEKLVASEGKSLGLVVDCFQSNHEGEIIERIHQASKQNESIVINAGAFTHTSIAIRDALECCTASIVEVHISNVFRRENFRHHSYISEVADGVICGLGVTGYLLALRYLSNDDG